MTEDQFGLTETNNNNEGTIQIDDFEVVISEVLNENISIFNTRNSVIGSMPIGYKIFQDYKRIPELAFSEETIKWLEENQDSETVFIVGYKRDELDIYEVTKMSLLDLSDALSGAIKEGSFMAQHLYEILEKIKLNLCKKYGNGAWIPVSNELLNKSNSIIFKNDTPVLVVTNCGNDAFYNIVKREFAPESIELLFDFDSPWYVSSYESPKDIILADNTQGEFFEIVFQYPAMDKEVLMKVMRTEYNLFSVVSAEIVEDYQNTKKILEENYSDIDAILNALVENRLNADTEDLLDLIS